MGLGRTDMSITRSLTIFLCVVFLAPSRLEAQGNRRNTNGSKTVRFRAHWKGTRQWIGPDWFANPLYDWSVRKGKLIGVAAQLRSLALLSVELGAKNGQRFYLQVNVKLKSKFRARKPRSSIWAGIQIGRRGAIDDYRYAAVYGTSSTGALITHRGKLSLFGKLSKQAFPLTRGGIRLSLTARRLGSMVFLIFTGERSSQKITVEKFVRWDLIKGGIALVTSGPRLKPHQQREFEFEFSNFTLSGDLIQKFKNREFGPILWSQYTLSHGVLRLQAQLAPFDSPKPVSLWLQHGRGKWKRQLTRLTERNSRTTVFKVHNWRSSHKRYYEVRVSWNGRIYKWSGTIRREPRKKEDLKVACYSCDYGYLFPLLPMVAQTKRQDPDMILFLGDQIYEYYVSSPPAYWTTIHVSLLDFIYKFSLFGWTWRELLRDRPSVILPDDHDVFQANLWGHGGRALPKPREKIWTRGGYLMPGKWVAAVESMHVGHLPDPAVNIRLPIGIKPYFTSIVYGGIGFAVLEDRKFKTGPLSMPPKLRQAGIGGQLLGRRQERFLRRWAGNWTGHVMKVAISQTIFAKAETHNGPDLSRGSIILDSGAWPKAARNRVVRVLGDHNVFSVHGDQHLGILIRQGVKRYDDAGYAFMVPGTANGWPRAWWPGVSKYGIPKPGQKFTGKFRDDAGNPLHVLAVANPQPGSNVLGKQRVSPLQQGIRKGSGYGMLVFRKRSKSVKVNIYRLGNNGKTFDGFPKIVRVGGKPTNSDDS